MNLLPIMSSKQRVHSVLEGKPVDRFPVTAIYNMLIYDDFFSKITGNSQAMLESWSSSKDPDSFLRCYRQMVETLPFEILQPNPWAPNREWRETNEYVQKDAKPFRHNIKTGEWFPLEVTSSGHARDYHMNETRNIQDKKDADEKIKLFTADQQIALGQSDWIDAVVSAYGKDNFILSGGVVGTFYLSGNHFGQTNVLSMLREEPDLIEYVSKKVLEQNIEDIRRFARSGGDAIYIDDATTTNDMISVDDYERFSLPYMKAMVDEIHRLGHKAILIYFGGVADRLEQIASTGADGLVMEASMKGFVNDIDDAVRRIGKKITLFSNIDPIGVLQEGSDADVTAEITRQCAAGLKGRGMILSPASPITPFTSIDRIKFFIDKAKEIGRSN